MNARHREGGGTKWEEGWVMFLDLYCETHVICSLYINKRTCKSLVQLQDIKSTHKTQQPMHTKKPKTKNQTNKKAPNLQGLERTCKYSMIHISWKKFLNTLE